MSLSTSVEGIKPPDAVWRKRKEVWEACEAAGVECPRPVREFSGHDDPDPVVVDEGTSYEIDLSKIDKHITVLRFTNRW